MKYIVFMSPSGLEYPVLFPEFIDHSEIAKSIGDTPISAGFCSVDDRGHISVYGKSQTLNLVSLETTDKILINRAFNKVDWSKL